MFRSLSSTLCLLALLMPLGCHQGAGSAEVVEVEPDEKGVYPSNPFVLPTEPPFPEIEVVETSFDFGRMAIHTEDSHPFVIRNIGEVPVQLAKGPSTCQCTMGVLEVDVLQPGAETEVVLTWKPESHALEFSKSAAIWTNVPEMQRIDFEVRGQVYPRVSLVPGLDWTAGMLRNGEGATLMGVVYSLLDSDLEVTGIDCSHDWLVASYAPADQTKLESILGLSGYDLTCEILPHCPVGDFRGTLTIHTQVKDEILEDIVVNVNGTRTGPFSITSNNWTGGGEGTVGIVDMGSISLNDGKTIDLSLIISPLGEPLEMTPVSVHPEFLQFEIRRDENYPASAKERYYLTFTVPPSSELGDWTGENAGRVSFRTNIPEHEELSVGVEFKVENSN